MFEEAVFPYLREKQPEIICSQVVKICGIGESQVAADIQDMIEAQTNPTLAPYAKTGEVHLRITASEGIRNPEIGRIPDTAAQSIIIISLGYITDFVLRGREQSRITANGNPVTACITVLNLIGQAILDALPVECIEVLPPTEMRRSKACSIYIGRISTST